MIHPTIVHKPRFQRDLCKTALFEVCRLSARFLRLPVRCTQTGQAQISILEIFNIFTPRAFTTWHLWLIRLRRIAFPRSKSGIFDLNSNENYHFSKVSQLNPLSKNKFLSNIKLLACNVKFRKTLDFHLNR